MNKEYINVMELVSKEAISSIREIIQDSPNLSLPKRANRIAVILEKEGYLEIGCGTNRIVFAHRDDTDLNCVFKVALDNRGRKDNLLEMGMMPILNRDFVSESYGLSTAVEGYEHSRGIMLAQERVFPITSKEALEAYKPAMIHTLKILSKKWLLSDVGLGSFTNWGIRYTESGEKQVIILDYAYLRYKGDFVPHCEVCLTGTMIYDGLFNKTICSSVECKNEQMASTLELPYDDDICKFIEEDTLKLEGYCKGGFAEEEFAEENKEE